jgi:hypothetical protein
MKLVPLATRPLLVAVLTCGVILTRLCSAEEAPPESFLLTTPDRQCDEFNRSWKVSNQHSYLSIKVTIRWHAVGAKEMQEEFILQPRQVRGVGCAPAVEIVSAELMQF